MVGFYGGIKESASGSGKDFCPGCEVHPSRRKYLPKDWNGGNIPEDITVHVEDHTGRRFVQKEPSYERVYIAPKLAVPNSSPAKRGIIIIIRPYGFKFAIGDRVRKTKGSSWYGRVVGYYSTTLTPNGYCVESDRHAGSTQIYPESALEAM